MKLCTICFQFVDNETQVGIVSQYRPGQDLDLKTSKEFSAFMDSAIAQAAMGTLAIKPKGIQFIDKNGSPIERESLVMWQADAIKLLAKVQRLNTETGTVKIRMMSHPPDVIEVQPKVLEVIHEQRRNEHPED